MEALTPATQNNIIKLLITDDAFCGISVANLKKEYFSNAIAQDIVTICFTYYSNYREAPKTHFKDEFHLLVKDMDEDTKGSYVAYTRLLQSLEPNRRYIENTLNEFIQAKAMKNGLIQAAKALEEGNTSKAKNIIIEATKAGMANLDDSLDYLTDFSDIDKRGEVDTFLCTTGIDALDHEIGGFKRGELVVDVAGYKGYKTFQAAHKIHHFIQNGLKVLYYSFEVDIAEFSLRMDMINTGRGRNKIGDDITYPFYDHIRKEAVKVTKKVESVFDKDICKAARTRMLENGGSLKIKKYPMGCASLDDIEAHIDYLESQEGWLPDVVIVDYIDIADLSNFGTEERHVLNKAYIALKGMADRRNILVYTMSQVNAEFLNGNRPGKSAVANDKRKVGNCDLMIAYYASEADQRAGMGKIAVVANRRGPDGFTISYSHCLDVGKVVASSWRDSQATEDVLEMFNNI